MTGDQPPARRLHCLLDENIARSVGTYLVSRDHQVVESREVVGTQAADHVLEWIAAEESLILVTHDRDFKTIIKGISRRRLRRHAMILWLNISEPRAVRRLSQVFDLNEKHILDSFDHGPQIELIHVQEDRVVFRYWFPGGHKDPKS